MNKKNKKDDFFGQMQNYEIDKMDRVNFKFIIIIAVPILSIIIFTTLFLTNANTINNVTLGILMASFFLSLLLGLFYLGFIIGKNIAEFISGKLSSGIVIIIIMIILIFAAISITNNIIPEKIQPLLSTIIAALATLFAAILALMGIHYTATKKQEERMYKNKLVFVKDEATDETVEYVLRQDKDCKSIDICIRNISDNFGFLCGVYRVCGCDLYSIEDKLPYFPIAPKKSYNLKSVNYKAGDDQLILIYKDIEDKYYYIHLRIVSSQNIEIMKIDLCNMSFVSERLKLTKRMEEKLKSKQKKNVIKKTEVELEEAVSMNKENTKPIYTKSVNGYELIIDEGGNDLTDKTLLEKLKKERLTISRENRVKAYIIFNNQQLVAMATYKPIDYESFISIYGLGEGKYNLYGERFIEIIKNHIS